MNKNFLFIKHLRILHVPYNQLFSE